MGKHKTEFSKHMDMGDYVVVINSKDVELSGRKKDQKIYRKHSGYPGGFKEIKFKKMIEERPERVIQLSVKRMLPSNRLRDDRMNRLKVFEDENHPYKDKLEE